MIYVKYNGEEHFHEVSFKRINKNVVSLKGINETSAEGFLTYNSKGEQLGDFSDYKAVYRQLDNEIQYSNDNETYIEPAPAEERQPTTEEIKQALIDGVQNYMDSVAQTRGYDSLLSLVSYCDDTENEKFRAEGNAGKIWRSQIWTYCYEQLDLVLAGERSIPTLDELVRELPEINW